MRTVARPLLVALTIAVALAGSASGPAARAALPMAPPASVGFSADGLKAYEQALHALVDEGRLAGVVTLVSRRGKVVTFDAYGHQDAAAKTSIAQDTIFRIASMTKPIAGVAMMMLYEEGKWTLDDPVAKHIPAFKDLKVATPAGEVAQTAPMTMRQLMSHTAGFDVSGAEAYRKASLTDFTQPLQAMIDKLARMPLAVQPGTDWRYGPSVDIQGYIVEKLSGVPLDEFLRRRIFEPLKMTDTGFWVDPAKAGRITRLHTYGPDQKIIVAENPARSATTRPAFLSGSGGLLSTVADYWRFSQMLLNGGELDGARLLKRATVELMRKNVLAEGVSVDTYGSPQPGLGFGLDFAIVMDAAKADTPQPVGTYYWGGAFGTWFWIDPVNDLIVIGMIQNLNGSIPTGPTPPLRRISPKMVYAALADSTR